MFGYFIYSAAVLARADPGFAATYAEPLNNIIRDYANPSRTDAFFPFARHFDWFEGHSWAGGLYTFSSSAC